MKMHFPISIMEETTCSQGDLLLHCFLILCLFLSLSLLHPPSVLCWPPPPPHSFSCSTRLYSSCFCISCLLVKANQSPIVCTSWTEVNVWNSLMSFFDVSIWLLNKSILIFTPQGIQVLNWINVRLLCELRICAAACLSVVLQLWHWNKRLQSLQHNTRFPFESV